MKKLQINYILLSLFILGLHQTTTDAMFPNRDDQNQSGAKIPTEKVPKQRSFNSVSDEPIIYDVTSLTEEEKIDFNQELAKFKKDCFEIELQIQRYYQENPERRPKNDSDENGLMAGIKIEDAIQDIIRKIIAARTPAAEKARPAAASEDQPAVVAATAGATDNTAYQRLLLDKSKEAIGLYISTLRSQDKSLDQIQRLIENAIQEMEPLSGFEYRKILRDAKIIMNKSMERGERENIALFSIQQYIALLRDGLYKDTDALDFYPLMQRTAKNIIDELKTEEFFAQEQALAERQAAPRPSASAHLQLNQKTMNCHKQLLL